MNASVRDYSRPTRRERIEDWFFGGFAVTLIAFSLCALAAKYFASTSNSLAALLLARRLTLFGACAIALITVGILEYVFRHRLWFTLSCSAVIALGTVSTLTQAAEIPTYSVRYRAALEHAATQRFGLDAPIARIAAQIHAESGWRPDAASVYAQGLAQFTPATAKWLPQVCPDVGEPDPWDPQWSLRAIACYDRFLYDNAPAWNECNRWAFTLSDYNGGAGTRAREQRLALEHGANPRQWFSGVEPYSARAPAAFRENRGYVRQILLRLEPVYIDAGWPGTDACL